MMITEMTPIVMTMIKIVMIMIHHSEIMITTIMMMRMTMPVKAQSAQIPSFFYLPTAAQGTCDGNDHDHDGNDHYDGDED